MKLRETAKLRLFAFLGLRMLYRAKPSVLERGPNYVVIQIPFNKDTKSFYNGLAFGPLMMGAECAAGYLFGHYITGDEKYARIGWAITGLTASLEQRYRDNGVFTASLKAPAKETLDEVIRDGIPRTVKVEVIGEDSARICSHFVFDVHLMPPRKPNVSNTQRSQ